MRKGLLRHLDAVRNVSLPADRVPFRLGAADVGWVRQRDAGRLLDAGHGCRRVGEALVLPDAAALPALAATLAAGGAFVWRGEAFDVRADPDGAVLSTIDRGALPWFGIAAQGVHVNGLVRRADGLHLWVARRAANRLMDPGKLDHIFAGGIAAGFSAEQTLVKEGAEEAGLPASLVRQAVQAGFVSYVTERPEGLRRDRLHCYDLWLPEFVRPVPADGEVAGFELWPLARVVETVRQTDDFKFNVNLVLLDLFARLGVASEF